MKKVFNSIMKFFSWFAITKWWTFWSNLRFKNSVKYDVKLNEEDFVSTVQDIKSLSRRIYGKFTYEADGADQLWDAVVPPPQNYLHYLLGAISDDCDGFHSTLYHCLNRSGIECYLLSVVGVGGGHCLLLFKLNDLWHTTDYTTTYKGYKDVKECVKEYNIEYKKKYGYNKEYLYNAIIKYDYDKKKFIGMSLEKLYK